jgi:hypothetical protein
MRRSIRPVSILDLVRRRKRRPDAILHTIYAGPAASPGGLAVWPAGPRLAGIAEHAEGEGKVRNLSDVVQRSFSYITRALTENADSAADAGSIRCLDHVRHFLPAAAKAERLILRP